MPPQEVVHRLVLAARARADAAGAWRRAVRPLPAGLVDRALPTLGSPPDPGALSPVWRASLAADAEALLRGRFTLLGVERDAAQRCAWALDPRTGASWDAEPPGTDPKNVWELSRLQHLQVLAWSGASGDAAAEDAVRRDLLDWHLANPPYHGLQWTSGLEAASRVASLLAITTLLPELSGDDVLRPMVWESLALHGARIARYPTRFSAANNHAVGELAALVILGHAAPDLPDAEAWRGRVGDLVAVAERQQHPDGVGAEQSPTYHAYTLEWLLLARQVLARHGRHLPVDDLLRRGADALSEWCDGPPPRIGDDDEGVVLRQRLAPDDLVRSVAAAIAGALGDASVAPPAAQADPRAALMGVHVLAGPPRTASRTFADGGTTILRGRLGGRAARVVVDHGPLGFERTAGHGHADALSVWLDVGGRPVVIDFGTYAYGADPAWRAWARGTAAHPTVTVDGLGQATPVGGFSWEGAPRARLEHADATRVVAANDGWEGGLRARHRREIRVGAEIVVVDLVEGQGEHTVTARWTFAPDLEVVASGDRWLVRDGATPLCAVRVSGHGFEARTVVGGSVPGPGAVSPRWGAVAPATTLEITRRGPLPARVETFFEAP